MTNHFSYDEVISLDKIQHLGIQAINAHYWENRTNPESPLKVLDTLHFVFENGLNVALSGRTDECLKLVTPDIEKDKKELIEQFHGKIVLVSQEISKNDLWIDAGKVEYISLRKNENGEYLNDAILICCEHKEIVVFYDGDSIEMEEVFEEINDDENA